MSRILALDYGLKRTGIAVTDNACIIANGLTTVATKDLHSFLSKYLEEEDVKAVVIGYPLDNKGLPSSNAKNIENFVLKFKQLYPKLPIIYHDERFTSVLAQKAILMSGKKKKDRQNKALVDEVSATLILQSYLEQNLFTPSPF